MSSLRVAEAGSGDGGAALAATQRELEATRERITALEAELKAALARPEPEGEGNEAAEAGEGGEKQGGEKPDQEKLLGAKVLKLQKLLRRAEQMLAEKKKAHKATTLTRPAPLPDQRWVSSQEMAEQAE